MPFFLIDLAKGNNTHTTGKGYCLVIVDTHARYAPSGLVSSEE
jgi:hypothetical protein